MSVRYLDPGIPGSCQAGAPDNGGAFPDPPPGQTQKKTTVVGNGGGFGVLIPPG